MTINNYHLLYIASHPHILINIYNIDKCSMCFFLDYSDDSFFASGNLSVNGVYTPSSERYVSLIAQTTHEGITLCTLFPSLLCTHQVNCLYAAKR